MDLHKELMNFNYRKADVPVSVLFPNIDLSKVKSDFSYLKSDNPHETVFRVSRELWNGGYDKFMADYGFWDAVYKDFSGHCHQCSPVLGVVLKALDFDVSFLECYRIRTSYLQDGKIVQVPPSEEPNPEVREEFCGINRIPYCCLEVLIEGEPYYVTGKHLKPKEDGAVSLLSPVCYRDFVGVFKHQSDQSKSGIYLQPVSDGERVVWMKQTERDPEPELFAAFFRMRLV